MEKYFLRTLTVRKREENKKIINNMLGWLVAGVLRPANIYGQIKTGPDLGQCRIKATL